mmetsp:Transcript_37660/g.96241  ORF Transcript_37660/g.96241 Transcript_37660/m.96241 type:complete len:269 (-) Transcript_37660:77-883(-)
MGASTRVRCLLILFLVLGIRLGNRVDAALCLCAAVGVLHVLEPPSALHAVLEPLVLVDPEGAVHVTDRGVAIVVQGVVRHALGVYIVPAVFKRPKREGVHLLVLPNLEGRPLEAVVPPSAVDPELGLVLLETPQQWLHLCQPVIFLHIFEEEVVAILFFKFLWTCTTLGPVPQRLKPIVPLHLVHELERLGEEVVGVNEENLDPVQQAGLVDGVEDDIVPCDQRRGEDGVLELLGSTLKVRQKLLLQVCEAVPFVLAVQLLGGFLGFR